MGNNDSGKYEIDLDELETSITSLVSKICTLQHGGDKKVVDAELERLGVLSELTSASLERLETIPVDIRPCYPLAGENCDADNTRDNDPPLCRVCPRGRNNGNNGGSGGSGQSGGIANSAGVVHV